MYIVKFQKSVPERKIQNSHRFLSRCLSIRKCNRYENFWPDLLSLNPTSKFHGQGYLAKINFYYLLSLNLRSESLRTNTNCRATLPDSVWLHICISNPFRISIMAQSQIANWQWPRTGVRPLLQTVIGIEQYMWHMLPCCAFRTCHYNKVTHTSPCR